MLTDAEPNRTLVIRGMDLHHTEVVVRDAFARFGGVSSVGVLKAS